MPALRRKASPLTSLLAIVFTISPAFAAAQAVDTAPPTPIKPLVYDVITIKPDKSASGSVDISSHADRYSAQNVSLKELLAETYDIKEDQVSGIPAALDSARFDLQATISDYDPAVAKQMTPEQQRQMLLPLLVERFHLKTHTEIKTLSIFELVVLKDGPKFQPSADQTRHGGGSIHVSGAHNSTKLTAHDMPMASFAKSLSGQVQRPVIDRTGLAGNFDLAFNWSPDDSAPDADASSIFTALQEQLALKLQPAKGPVETLVVDQAAMPLQN